MSFEMIANSLGASAMNFHIGIIAFSFLYSPIGLIIGILMNILSRKNVFEADEYAKLTHTYPSRVALLRARHRRLDRREPRVRPPVLGEALEDDEGVGPRQRRAEEGVHGDQGARLLVHAGPVPRERGAARQALAQQQQVVRQTRAELVDGEHRSAKTWESVRRHQHVGPARLLDGGSQRPDICTFPREVPSTAEAVGRREAAPRRALAPRREVVAEPIQAF